MRVLAIRGENLASLEGPFSLEFDREPLAGAGLFAITGPTGAGKSTLLDALCLALFDRTPRLAGGGGARVGRPEDQRGERLAAGDPRWILRRGAVRGRAEVEFVGVDGRRYRAAWSVRRARGRRTGRLQAAELSLEDLGTGRVLGGTKRETLAAIEERLGLTFDQFRRSVLLAQGEFAAFLRADEAERGALLERVTGTALYGLLSVAAFRRAKEEGAELDRLEAEAAGIRVLADADRRALEAERERAEAALRGARERAETARAALAWHERLAGLEKAAASAREDLERAQRAWAGAEGARQELEEAERAWAVRHLVGEADRCRRELQEASRELEDARRAETEAGRGAREARERLGAAEQALREAEAARQAAAPELERAAALDREVEAARRALAEAQEAVEQAAGALAEAEECAGGIESRLRGLEAAREAARAWLEAHQHLEPLASDWSRWGAELGRYGRLHRRAGEVAREAERARCDREASAAALERARQAASGAEAQVRRAGDRCRKAEERAAKVSLERIRKERRGLLDRRKVLEALAALAEQALRGAETAREAEAAARKALEEAGRLQEERARIGREEAELAARRDEAQQALRSARAALDLEARRAELRPGEPCPLCGSTDHPWAEKGAPGSDVVEALEERLAEVEGRLRDALRRAAGIEERVRELKARAREQEERAAAARAEQEERAARWAELRARLPELPLPERPGEAGAADAVERILEDVARALEAVDRAEEEAARVLEERDAARKALDAAREALERARAEESEAARALAEAEARLGSLEREGRTLEAEMAELRQALGPVLRRGEGWEEALDQDPEALRERLAEAVGGWSRRTAEAEALARDIRDLEAQRTAARSVVAERAAAAGKARAESDRRAKRVEELEAERAGLLGGEPVEAVRARLEERVEEARRDRDRALAAAERAGRELAAAEARREAAERAAREAADRSGRAEQALADALAARGLSPDRVRELLARGEDWLETQRGRLEGLRREVDRAATVLREREAQLEAHREGTRPDLDPGAARGLLDELSREIERLEEERVRIVRELALDDHARGRLEDLGPRIQAQRERARVWQALSDLIGSHDGKKFRSFAQGLTLDLLLAHANRHLEDLAPRYRLERVPGYHLAIQVVDRYMGDEVRGVNSLSGGESFLVSLALALGLSSLSSRQVRVESLFVDEGFGSLDPETLEVVLATLDALQASGRRIGVISHVPGLAERIGVRVEVVPDGSGRSRVRVAGL